ncbi:Tyrosine kinase receptor Cad96Ca [Stylophora pistillata]|uniref:Tyrosine kinase receptor Cad96Ca n=1 Tax=Stylophora pistillata TaxID=50429 RepID=A0A2B4SXF6_STYPI|nr:Tyrosine kinase receptor Cad96Ca [Stylophora pistillata]
MPCYLLHYVKPRIIIKTSTAQTLDEGATRTLPCVASGIPKPYNTWYVSVCVGFTSRTKIKKVVHVDVGCSACSRRQFVADQTDPGKADPRAVSAEIGNVRSEGGGGAGPPPLSLVFKYLMSILLKLSDGLVDCVAPGTTVCSQVRPLFVIDVAGAECKDDVKVQEDPNNSSYTITSANTNDTEMYRCEAVVNSPTLGHYIDHYGVQAPKYTREVSNGLVALKKQDCAASISKSAAKKQTQTEFETVNYVCIVHPKPAAQIVWTLNEKNLTNTLPYNISTDNEPVENFKPQKTRASLDIDRVTWRHKGAFSCVALNSDGRTNQTTDLEVQSSFTCETIGNPPTQSKKWQFNGVDIPGESCSGCLTTTFIKASVTQADAGWYSCTGTNSLGEGPPARARLLIKAASCPRCGSVTVDLTLSFNSPTKEQDVITTLRNAVVDGKLGEISVSSIKVARLDNKGITTEIRTSSDQSPVTIIIGAVLRILWLACRTIELNRKDAGVAGEESTYRESTDHRKVNIIHQDLSARNVLVGEKETCKVRNFGMARDVQQDDIYEKTTKVRDYGKELGGRSRKETNFLKAEDRTHRSGEPTREAAELGNFRRPTLRKRRRGLRSRGDRISPEMRNETGDLAALCPEKT